MINNEELELIYKHVVKDVQLFLYLMRNVDEYVTHGYIKINPNYNWKNDQQYYHPTIKGFWRCYRYKNTSLSK